MATPKPWSYSGLETFKSCPRKFYAENVAKTVPRTESDAQRYGTAVHLAFEQRQRDGRPLDPELILHEPKMREIERKRVEGTQRVETKFGLNRKLEPCDFFDPNVWHRGVIDYEADLGTGVLHVVDYKTGKVKPKFLQLKLYGLYEMLCGANRVKAEFYWTQTRDSTNFPMDRSMIKPILLEVLPDLCQYRDAFHHDIWQPRQNGLCAKWCDVKDCEFQGAVRR